MPKLAQKARDFFTDSHKKITDMINSGDILAETHKKLTEKIKDINLKDFGINF